MSRSLGPVSIKLGKGLDFPKAVYLGRVKTSPELRGFLPTILSIHPCFKPAVPGVVRGFPEDSLPEFLDFSYFLEDKFSGK